MRFGKLKIPTQFFLAHNVVHLTLLKCTLKNGEDGKFYVFFTTIIYILKVVQFKPLLDVWPRIEWLLRILLIISSLKIFFLSSLNFDGKMAYCFSAASGLIFCNKCREETSLYEISHPSPHRSSLIVASSEPRYSEGRLYTYFPGAAKIT